MQSNYTRDTAVATDRNVLVMSTVVSTPAVVTTVEKMSLSPSTRYIIKPYPSCSTTVSITQGPSNIPTKSNFNKEKSRGNLHLITKSTECG